MYKEVTIEEAVKAYIEEKEVFMTRSIGQMKLDELYESACEGHKFLINVAPAVEKPEWSGKNPEVLRPEPGPPPAEPKRKLDIGKVKALKAAGWTQKAIADEMGVTPGYISMILKEEKSDGK